MKEPTSGPARILVVEDDRKTADLVATYLRHAGHRPAIATNGASGLERARHEGFDLLILDVMLPGADGRDICRTVRETSSTPIIFLTARTIEDERIAGLDLGADDYVTKPFSPRELVARVNALLRRVPPGGGDVLHEDGVTVNLETRRVEVGGARIDLTPSEFEILRALMERPGRVLTRGQLLGRLSPRGEPPLDRTVDVHVRNIRRKLEPGGDRRGAGGSHRDRVRRRLPVALVIRSLRTRFFLIVWPLVVAATIGVGWYLGRWTRVELRRELLVDDAHSIKMSEEALVRGVEQALSAAAGREEARTLLAAVALGVEAIGGAPPSLLITDAAGTILLSSAGLETGGLDLDIRPDGVLEIRAERVVLENERREVRMRTTGVPVRVSDDVSADVIPPDAPAPVRVFVIPQPGSGAIEAIGRTEDLHVERVVDSADRTIGSAVLWASLLAAIVTFLLSRPVVGRATQLAGAARRIRAGDLSARVPATSSDELGDVARAFNDMAQELERSETLKRRMVSDVAHELRTPLTNLVGLLEAVEDGLRSPDASTLGSLREEVGLLERLVEDLQEIAVADAGQLALDLEAVDVVEEARTVRTSFEGAGEDARIEIAGGEGLLARTDRRRLSQILRNLLRNAITHSPPEASVRVFVERADERIRVTVADRGPGIAPEHRELVWERFYRVETSRDRASGGMGLGLPIVKRLVSGLGGEVGVDSVPGEGATFWFTLPAA